MRFVKGVLRKNWKSDIKLSKKETLLYKGDFTAKRIVLTRGKQRKMGGFLVRTDLALEAREGVRGDARKMSGVRVDEYVGAKGEVHVTKVYIDTKNAARVLRKPIGTYVTMEAPAMSEAEDASREMVSECLAQELCKILPDQKREGSVLVVGLGNREVTADSLGPRVVDTLLITRHLVKAYGAAYPSESKYQVSALEPGVMAKTGMETAEIVQGVVKETAPDMIIAVDALAARSIRRINRTIQITNTGIQPGSGVGNHRSPLTQDNLGIPVIAIGVPTVVDAATIVNDVLEQRIAGNAARESFRMPHMPELNNMYMTGKDVDAVIKRVGLVVSEGINLALSSYI
jgi:spore protease